MFCYTGDSCQWIRNSFSKRLSYSARNLKECQQNDKCISLRELLLNRDNELDFQYLGLRTAPGSDPVCFPLSITI